MPRKDPGMPYDLAPMLKARFGQPDDCAALQEHCETMARRRNECCLQSAREIEQIYPQFRTEQALEYAKDSGVLFKSGIMQALCELGLAEGIYGEEYHRLFGWEPRGIVTFKE